MEFKNIEFDKIEYSKLIDESDKIQFLSKFTFEIAETKENDRTQLLAEEIEDLYFDILKFIDAEKYKVLKPLHQIEVFEKKQNALENMYGQLKKKYPEDVLTAEQRKERHYLSLKDFLEFRVPTVDGGYFFYKKKIGYKVYLEFKKMILNKSKESSKPSLSETLEIPFYDNLEDFKEMYLDILAKTENLSKIELLRKYKKRYNEFVPTDWGNDDLFGGTIGLYFGDFFNEKKIRANTKIYDFF